MSETTKAKLEAALREHIANECEGAFLVDWYLISASAPSNTDNSTMYTYIGSNSSIHNLRGLCLMGMDKLDELSMSMGDSDEV